MSATPDRMPAPHLAMLWESVDPADALTTRFGFSDALAASDWVHDVLWERWAIPVADCERLVMSAGNLLAWITADGKRLIAKWSIFPVLFRRLSDVATLTRSLQTSGVPVAAPIPAKDGRLRVEVDNVSLGVYPVVDGDLLEVDDVTQVTEAGHMLATLHRALAAYPRRIDGGVPSPGQQLVHNDFRSANILHDGVRITAVLDFEEVTYRKRVADLARATVLLGTRYHNWRQTDPVVQEVFVSAYHDRYPLPPAEQKELREHIAVVVKQLGWADNP